MVSREPVILLPENVTQILIIFIMLLQISNELPQIHPQTSVWPLHQTFSGWTSAHSNSYYQLKYATQRNLLSKGKKPHPQFTSWRRWARRVAPCPCTPLALGKTEMKFLYTVMRDDLRQGLRENAIMVLWKRIIRYKFEKWSITITQPPTCNHQPNILGKHFTFGSPNDKCSYQIVYNYLVLIF